MRCSTCGRVRLSLFQPAASNVAVRSRKARSLARCSVMSVWMPTHSRSLPSPSKVGTARIEKRRHCPSRRRTRCSKMKVRRPATAAFQASMVELRIVGMNRLRPAEALIFVVGLSCERSPPWLLARHLACGVVRPENAFHGIDGRTEPLLAFAEALLVAPCCCSVHGHHKHAVEAAIAMDGGDAIANQGAASVRSYMRVSMIERGALPGSACLKMARRTRYHFAE